MASGSLAVVMENPSCFFVVEIGDPVPSSFSEKDKAKNPKQFTWVLLLRAQKAVSFLSWLVLAFGRLLTTAKKCVFFFKNIEEHQSNGRLLRFLRVFLIFSVVALLVDIYAHLNEWNLHLIQPSEVTSLARRAYLFWLSFIAHYIGPLVIRLSKFCVLLFLIQSLDRFILCFGCFWINYKNLKLALMQGEVSGPEESSYHPMVLVQIPMCNETEVYNQSISAACQLDWPRDRVLIQVLDDLDIKSAQLLIKNEVSSWRKKGVNIVYRHQFFRTGYKASNLNSAMGCDCVKEYEFVAIFDADFQPNADFLKKIVPYFKDNPELGLVQARWSFINKDENLLTRLQNINLCFHFEVEQQVNGVFLNFFGFNGTVGVWRIKALEDSRGWLERMDYC